MAKCLFLSALYLPRDSPSPGTHAVKEVCFHIQNGPIAEILTCIPCWSFYQLDPALGPCTLLPNGACYIDQLGERHLPLPSTNFPFSLSPPVLLSSSPLSVAAAERLYSQLERNRLLSNELKLTLHGLCD